jgi:hypothetical protein
MDSLEGVVKSRLAPPGRVEKVLECSFTPCKLRFCAHFRLAREHNPTFYDTLYYEGVNHLEGNQGEEGITPWG